MAMMTREVLALGLIVVGVLLVVVAVRELVAWWLR